MVSRHTFIIAEAGINHNGSLSLAEQLIEHAAAAGADAVKFQTFQVASLVHKDVQMATYQTTNLGSSISQFEMLKAVELSPEQHQKLILKCQQAGIEFMSTPFDLASIDLLSKLGVRRFKIGSGDLRNAPYLVKIGACHKPVYVSTGMANLAGIEHGLAFIVHGALIKTPPVNLAAALELLNSAEAKNWLKSHVTLLHCVSQYPTPIEAVNLLAIKTLQEKFDLPIGYSDHSTSVSVPVGAVAMGATVIEKHFTTDKSLPGADHKASLEPAELKEMVLRIREMDLALGSGLKEPTESEIETYALVGKRVVAARPIRKGETFSVDNLTTMRAETGIDAVYYFDLLGCLAEIDYAQLDPILQSAVAN